MKISATGNGRPGISNQPSCLWQLEKMQKNENCMVEDIG